MNRMLTRRIAVRNTLTAGLVLALPGFIGCDKPVNKPPRPIDPAAPPSSDPALPPGESNPQSGMNSDYNSNNDQRFDQRVSRVDNKSGPLPPKISKADAKYQNQPNGNQSCMNCAQFVAETQECKLVEGKVQPEGWCSLYAAPTA